MSLTNQRAAYTDCYELFARATDTPTGVRIPLGTIAEARMFQIRMHKARSIERDASRRVYPKDSPLYDASEYDGFKVQIREDTDGVYWIYVSPHGRHELLAQIEPIEDPTPNNSEEPIPNANLQPPPLD